MTQTTINSYEGWIGRDAYDVNGDKIGEIDNIFYDDIAGRPEWLAIRTGFFGMNTSFAPISGATVYLHDDHEDLQLPYTKDQVKDSPNAAPNDTGLHPADEERLFDHYGFVHDARRYTADDVEPERFDRDYPVDTERMQAYRDPAAVDEAEVTRSEEQLRVGTETVETGKARLRKYVVTEHQSVTVPVSHEEVRVEREPLDGSGEITGDEDAEVTLHAERPVVGTETYAKEKVRLTTETVADEETVEGDVRKEQVEVESDDGSRVIRSDGPPNRY